MRVNNQEMRWAALLLALGAAVHGDVAEIGHVPQGSNPTLYDAVEDAIIQLDEGSFNDTIYCADRGAACTAFLVEFYSDWCGHCRTYAPLYKALAKDVRGWQRVVKIAAMNCADPINEVTCRANGVTFFPYLKFFPRNSSDESSGSKLRPYQSLAEMRDQLTQAVVADYDQNRFEDWPSFDFLGDITTYGALWTGSKESTDSMAIIFESDPSSLIGAQLLLDLTKYDDKLLARRCLKSHPLVDALHINDFPTLAVFKRGERVPVLIAELRRLLFTELEEYLRNDDQVREFAFSSRKNRTSSSCDVEPEKCSERYFVSESDMLKAMRYALFREVARTGNELSGANLTALYSFVDALAEHFPHSGASNDSESEVALQNSERARAVFATLREFLDQRGLTTPLPVEEWQKEFTRAEEEQQNPFNVNSDWEHCKGSSAQFRGYTCGLWTTFHAMTVQAYKDGLNDPNFRPLPVLQAIRDWVGEFFGCQHCRDHFIRMTTRTFKMEAQVRKDEDVFLYLWRAHNIVNARLKGRDTEDPLFPKYQFPAPFLCANCSADDATVRPFLLEYYSNIRPFRGTPAERILLR
uniref:Sulfhydryl oxidase n=1 Tax=Steinernema glaseri TaxID=37863 RepID=A0A1I8A1G4_9BILA